MPRCTVGHSANSTRDKQATQAHGGTHIHRRPPRVPSACTAAAGVEYHIRRPHSWGRPCIPCQRRPQTLACRVAPKLEKYSGPYQSNLCLVCSFVVDAGLSMRQQRGGGHSPAHMSPSQRLRSPGNWSLGSRVARPQPASPLALAVRSAPAACVWRGAHREACPRSLLHLAPRKLMFSRACVSGVCSAVARRQPRRRPEWCARSCSRRQSRPQSRRRRTTTTELTLPTR